MALPIVWLTPMAVRSHFPSSRRSVSVGSGTGSIDYLSAGAGLLRYSFDCDSLLSGVTSSGSTRIIR